MSGRTLKASDHPRQVKGSMVGGQFANKTRGQATPVTIAMPPAPPAPPAVSRLKGAGLVETQRKLRGHNFYPSQRDWARIPPLYGAEGTPAEKKIARLHYFAAPNMDWYVVEVDHETGEGFGLCDLGVGMPEWGYVDLPELQAVRDGWRVVERELDYEPAPIPASKLPSYSN